jgi:hypothetical protein
MEPQRRRRSLRRAPARAAAGLAVALALPSPGAAERVSARIVNGSLSFRDPSVGALLRGPDPERAMAWCSGTLVGCRTFVTAAHCVCDLDGAACQSGPAAPDPAEWHVFLQHAGFFAAESIAVQPGFEFPTGDVAVVRLAAEATGIAPSPLAAEDPPFGSEATIVGFGRSGGLEDDYGLKRRGAVVTAACANDLPGGFVCWDFESPLGAPGTDSNTCNGDSGGPLFVDAAGTPVLTGLTTGGTSDSCLPADQSYDTSVALQRAFIDDRAGADLGSAACGGLPPVGDDATEVVGFSQSLDAGKTAGGHAFDVPEGARRLRVALNASEETGADFDLYVRAGSAPTLSEWDCRAFGSGQYGYCEFDAPAAGPWHVLVNRFSGAATYQVTATWFTEGGSPPPPPPAGPQSRAQRRCLNGLAEAGALVSAAQSRDALACVRHFARGRVDLLGRGGQPRTAQACVGNDVEGRVARALERTLRRDDERCRARAAQAPDFAYRGAGPVNAAARSGVQALVEDLFGAELDAALASEQAARAASRCQHAVARGAADLFEAVARQALEARRRSLRGRGALDPAASAAALEAALAAALERDAGGRIRRAGARLERAAWGACPVAAGSPGSLFPGACAGADDAIELTACAGAAARCRACRAASDMDGLALDCDAFDDGVPDLSCP